MDLGETASRTQTKPMRIRSSRGGESFFSGVKPDLDLFASGVKPSFDPIWIWTCFLLDLRRISSDLD
jgi:hypothetical protein